MILRRRASTRRRAPRASDDSPPARSRERPRSVLAPVTIQRASSRAHPLPVLAASTPRASSSLDEDARPQKVHGRRPSPASRPSPLVSRARSTSNETHAPRYRATISSARANDVRRRVRDGTTARSTRARRKFSESIHSQTTDRGT